MNSKISIGWITALSLVIFFVSDAWSIGGFFEWRTKHGYVMARGLVLTEEGYPIYAEYDEEGNIVVEEVAVRDESMEESYVLSGDEYRAIVNYYREFRNNNDDGVSRGAEIITADDYDGRAFQTIDGKPVNEDAKAELLPNVKTVLVRNQNQIFIPSTDPSLVQAKINLLNIDDSIVNDSSKKSVLLDNEGNVLHSTSNNIGFKVKFFESESEYDYTPEPGDKIYEPLSFVPLFMGDHLIGGSTATDENGKYTSLYMLPPCPGFTFDHYTPITLKLFYENFNPRMRNRQALYHITKPGYDFCSGLSASAPGYSLSGLMAQLNAMAIESTFPTNVYQTNFFVDTAVIGGEAYLSNERLDGEASGNEEPLPLGETKYKYEEPDLDPHADYKFDFDGDGQDDKARLGELVTTTNDAGEEIEIFEQNDTGPLQGIFLSSGAQDPDSEDQEKRQPDFVRLADKLPDLKHQGLLESISEDDFKETDFLVFRESNGMLITKREGLDEGEYRTRSFTYLDQDAGEATYSIMVRGPKSAPFDYVSKDWSDGDFYSAWQSEAEMNPALHQRKADHIRPQEKIRVIAINRKTGYMGSVRTTYGKFITDGYISMTIDKIVMRPPNLKIIAERKYTVEKGLTANQGEDSEREYLIGYEGAALASDRLITITTEWFDHDGSPLPEGLGEYGYTGRLAKIIAENTVDQDSGALANFSIKPGRHTENVQIGDDPNRNEHYYIQVNAEPLSENPDFSVTGAAPDGPLRYRPKNYVPIKAPVMDEAMTWEQYRAYRDFRRENPEADVKKPEPIYKWFYRPELQFSLYGLEMQNIFLTHNQVGQAIDIYNDDSNPVLTEESVIQVIYTLLEQNLDALQFLGSGQELVLALGDKEIVASIGEDSQITFEDLFYLNQIDEVDLLALRIFSNHDAANILWEYSMVSLNLAIDSDNNNEYDEPDISKEEEQIEFNVPGNKELPGKRIETHIGDSDQDRVPDFVDFESNNGKKPSKRFIPMILTVNGAEESINERLYVKFLYEASDPNEIFRIPRSNADYEDEKNLDAFVLPEKGLFRLWKKNGDEDRNKSKVSENGDFIPSSEFISLKDLGYDGSTSKIVLYIEAVGLSKEPSDLIVRANLEIR